MRKPWVLILVVLLAGWLTACGGAPQKSLGAKETAEAFLKAMEERDLAAAYALLSPDSQATIPAEQFREIVEKAWKDTYIAGFHVESVHDAVLTAGGTRASVPYAASLTTVDGSRTVIYNALSLVKVNERWGVIWPPVR
ncbi:MAG: NTF2-like N-terminal transpeptidase domain-containing protein [Chloroflexia bacterium]